MDYVTARPEDARRIYELVQATVNAIYPQYYPEEVVEFFRQHHSLERVTVDVEKGQVGLLLKHGRPVGTGSRVENHVTRVFVSPEYQGRGYGSLIMARLEEEIGGEYKCARLDASLAAVRFYEHRGYRTVGHEQIPVGNGKMLVYEVMEKTYTLHPAEDMVH